MGGCEKKRETKGRECCGICACEIVRVQMRVQMRLHMRVQRKAKVYLRVQRKACANACAKESKGILQV